MTARRATLLLATCLAGGRMAAAADPSISAPLRLRVCYQAPRWRRPSAARQVTFLNAQKRYDPMTAAQLQDEPLWTHDLLLFTWYGLSARLDETNISGLWTLRERMTTLFDGCYGLKQVIAFGEGYLAEFWLIGQRAEALRWDGKRYTLVTSPAPQGLQVVQFRRHERADELPVDVSTREGMRAPFQVGVFVSAGN